uniref:Cytochrome c oxidase subunit 7A2, mitochondrial n=1 Tax=Gasterosteus aculeatus aculeatus TaxID=481459 RepID=A0AAQ4P046_GASAC
MNRHIFALHQVARRTFSSCARRQVENKVPQKQKMFQEDNGLPIHLKGGPGDAILYRTTMVLTILGEDARAFRSTAGPLKVELAS